MDRYALLCPQTNHGSSFVIPRHRLMDRARRCMIFIMPNILAICGQMIYIYKITYDPYLIPRSTILSDTQTQSRISHPPGAIIETDLPWPPSRGMLSHFPGPRPGISMGIVKKKLKLIQIKSFFPLPVYSGSRIKNISRQAQTRTGKNL